MTIIATDRADIFAIEAKKNRVDAANEEALPYDSD
jgi:hypothetical protein